MTVLGQLLIKSGLVTSRQVEAALRRQEQLGGRLGTCLLELGAITERQLDAALAKQLGLPAAQVEDLRGISDDIHSLLPANLAISCEAVPFRVRDDQVDIAILEIKNRGLHDELAFVIGKWIHVHIANEVRIFEALQHYYGKDCSLRYRTLLERLDRDRAASGTGASDEAQDLVEIPFPALEGTEEDGERGPKLVYPPAPVTRRSIELTNEQRKSLKEEEQEAVQVEVAPAAPLKEAHPEPTPAEPTSSEPPAPQPAVAAEALPEPVAEAPPEPVAEAPPEPVAETPPEPVVEVLPEPAAAPAPSGAKVEQHPSAPWPAENVQQIGEMLLEKLGRHFSRVALFRVQKNAVQGWLGLGEGLDGDRLQHFSAGLDQASVFNSLIDGGHLFVGRLTRNPAHDELMVAIQGDPRTECLLSVVTVDDRPVVIAFGDCGLDGLEALDFGAVQQLTTRAGDAMRDLILRMKRKQA